MGRALGQTHQATLAVVVVDLGAALGVVLLVAIGVWMVWSNVMTTVTSLRFERPRITWTWLLD